MFRLFSSLLIFLIIHGCNLQPATQPISDQPDVISISDGFKTSKNFTLSDFVKEVSIIEMEGTIESFTKDPELVFFGEKQILVRDKHSAQFLLFNRSGKFVRNIGKPGKGPGEYSKWYTGTMNLSESKIIICDGFSGQAIIFSTNGNVLAQKNISSDINAPSIKGIFCNKDSLFEIIPHRPVKKNVPYYKVLQFDENLNLIKGIIPATTQEELDPYIDYRANIFTSNQGTFFWDTFSDTIYQFDGEKCSPEFIYHDKQSAKNSGKPFKITSVNFIHNHLITWTLTDSETGIPIFYNLNTKKAFTVHQDAQYGDLAPGYKTHTIRNDIFGFEPISLRNYKPSQNTCVSNLPWQLLAPTYKSELLSKLAVKDTELRDRIVDYIDHPSQSQGLVLILYSMK